MLFSRPQIFFQLGLDFLAGLQRCVFANVSLTIAAQKIHFQTGSHVHPHRAAFFVAGSVLRSSASSFTPGRVAT